MPALRSLLRLLGARPSEPSEAWAVKTSFADAGKPRRAKTSWEVGRDYERYIGHLYEQDGWRVEFHGALAGLNDRGRDLIARRGGVTHIIQCKRWARGKEVPEDAVFRFFACLVQYAVACGLVERGDDLLETLHRARIAGVIVTTAQLSPAARSACSVLGLRFREGVPFRRYPQIKCNVSAGGERIYHRPHDQFYDKVQIEADKGELYVWSAAEAEALGFRRARRLRDGWTDAVQNAF